MSRTRVGPKRGEAWQAAAADPDLVFTGRFGTAVDPRTLDRRFTARCAAAGVRQLTVHDARRTCATLLVDLDVHPRVIMRILRHADQAVTMEIYAKASSKATQEALRRLGDRYGEHSGERAYCCTLLLYSTDEPKPFLGKTRLTR